MPRRFILAAVVMSCFAAAGWAQTPSAPPPDSDSGKSVAKKPTRRSDAPPAESGPCHIGVIPIAGDLFRVEKYGFGGFGKRIATEGWALDELVVSRVRAAAPGRSVRRVPFTAAELIGAARRPSSFFGDKLREFAQRVAGRISCERYVVVHRHGGSSGEFGIGISRRPLFDKAILYAMMKILVYEGHTFELIRQAPASIKDDNSFGRSLLGLPSGPSRELDLSAFPDRPEDAARNPMLRDGVRALLTQSLDNTLPAILKP
jgi:hypothetical protein